MTEMLIIDGVRWRPEDAKARGLDASKAEVVATSAEPVEPAAVKPATPPVEADGFDPTARTVEEVLTELSRVQDDPDEVARIKAAEAEGKDRVTIAEWEPAGS